MAEVAAAHVGTEAPTPIAGAHNSGKNEREGTMPAVRRGEHKAEAPQDEFTKKTFTASQKILREQR
jgi:hypothetical protein